MSLYCKLLTKLPSRIGDFLVKLISRRNQGKSRILRQYFSEKYKVTVGDYTYGGCFNKSFNCGGTVIIGRFCSIAGDVHYFGANHPLNSVSTSAFFYNKDLSGYQVNDVKRCTLKIEDDVWIGYGVIITSSCNRIGTGAVIGGGAVL